MKKWKTGKPRSQTFHTQLYVMPVIDEDGKTENVLFYASNAGILTQIVEEHNKLVDIFRAKMRKEKANG